MFGFFLALISSKTFKLTSIPNDGKHLASFGFASHGTMTVDASGQLSANTTDLISVQLLTSSQYNDFLSAQSEEKAGCSEKYVFSDLELRLDPEQDIGNLTIAASRVYYVIAFACNDTFTSQTGVKFVFRNPTGYLDFRSYKSITVCLVLSVMAISIACVWFLLVFWKRKTASKMSVIIIAMMFGPFLDYICLNAHLNQLNAVDEQGIYYVLWLTFRIFNYTITATALMYASLGLSVFCESLSLKQSLRGFLASFVMVIAGVWASNWNSGDKVFPILLAFVSFSFYLRDILLGVSKASAVVTAALVGTEGGASEAALMYTEVRYLLIAAFALVVFNTVLVLIDGILYEWRRRILEGLSQFGLSIGFCFVYKLQTRTQSRYPTTENARDGTSLLGDSESHDIEIHELGSPASPLLDDPTV